MKTTRYPTPMFIRRSLQLIALFACAPVLLIAEQRHGAPVNLANAQVLNTKGQHINYSQKQFERMNAERPSTVTPAFPARGLTPTDATQQPFWQYSVFGAGIGASNIVIGPTPTDGTAAEIVIGGASGSDFGGDDFWQSIRHNPTTGNYDQLFVSPLYSASINRIALGNVLGDSNQEIVVMLSDGRIFFYDFATKASLGFISTGQSDLLGLSLTDLTGDGYAELIVTTSNDLFVYDSAGNLLWQVLGAGGYDVVAGQMDNDPALEIAGSNGKVVDSASHAIQWTYTGAGGFGVHLRLAPLSGQSYQQLIGAQGWQYVNSYDVAKKLPLWSIVTAQDIGGLRVADVTNDGTPEVLIGDGQWGSIHVYDLLTQHEDWSISNPEHGVTDIAVGDVDGDGVLDVLWGAGYTSTGADHLYVADSVGSHAIKFTSVDLEGPFRGPAIGDLDGDGKAELVVCSTFSDAAYSSGRILVFDMATLTLRGMSNPVCNNFAWTGVHDLKLRDVDGDGRQDILVAGDFLYDGDLEIYSFDGSNTFSLKWTNSTRPSGSPYSVVDVADLDGNGTQEIIVGNTVAHTGSSGVFLRIYNYPDTTESWTSVLLAPIFNSVNSLVVQDLDRNGSLEFVGLASTGDLFTFDGPTRTLVNLTQNPNVSIATGQAKPPGLIVGDQTGFGHVFRFKNDKYKQTFAVDLGSGTLDGLTATNEGLWVGDEGTLTLRGAPNYSTVLWQSPVVGSDFGQTIATIKRNSQRRVFSSSSYSVSGFTYTTN